MIFNKYRNIFLAIFCSLFAAVSCSSCDDNDDPVEPMPSHTLLIYMAGDNSLSDYCKPNIDLIKKGLLEATNDMNLIVYKDNRDTGDQLPSLFQLKRVYDNKTKVARIDTVMIEQFYVEHNSCDPKVFQSIVNYTFKIFNTEVKGLELWSHGMSWMPSPTITKSTRYIGEDTQGNSRNYMELWDIRTALEGCPHLDYIMLDACFTGLAEVAYEFDNVTDYIFGPITEIMGYGFPYRTMIPILANCTVSSSVQHALENCVADFTTCGIYGDYGYTITLLNTAKAKSMASSLAKLRKAVPEKLEDLAKNGMKLEADFQHYGRSRVGSRYYFYEISDYVKYLSANGSAEIKNLAKEVEDNSMVVKYANTPKFTDGGEAINLKGCKGLGVSIPELFYLTGDGERLTKYYGYTKWGKALGY